MDWKNRRTDSLDPRIRAEIIRFLREWLPPQARDQYREMIQNDPANWSRHPHFASGLIVEHALRGNGITEKTLGIRDLDQIWPELLRDAVGKSLPEPGPSNGDPAD